MLSFASFRGKLNPLSLVSVCLSVRFGQDLQYFFSYTHTQSEDMTLAGKMQLIWPGVF